MLKKYQVTSRNYPSLHRLHQPQAPGRKATMDLLRTPYLLIPDQGPFWIVAVRVNPGGMVAFSSAIFAGVGGRNP
jgi:hypothetical protein